jgi:hypothetical protein
VHEEEHGVEQLQLEYRRPAVECLDQIDTGIRGGAEHAFGRG